MFVYCPKELSSHVLEASIPDTVAQLAPLSVDFSTHKLIVIGEFENPRSIPSRVPFCENIPLSSTPEELSGKLLAKLPSTPASVSASPPQLLQVSLVRSLQEGDMSLEGDQLDESSKYGRGYSASPPKNVSYDMLPSAYVYKPGSTLIKPS